jgi:DNA-binding NtrC family response regulator
VPQLSIAVIDTQSSVHSSVQELLGAGFEVLRLSESDINGPALSRIGTFLVGNTSDDPAQMMATVRRLKQLRPCTPIILLAWTSSERLAIAALKSGVVDYFSPPIDLREVAGAVRRCAPCPRDAEWRDKSAKPGASSRAIIGKSPSMQAVRERMMRVAQRDCNALILGETGTGKDLVAEAIHSNSLRHNKPFICANCAAIPDTLLESELFGYERGAFTGADRTTEGMIRQAQHGTVFFDEIGELTPYAQAKILRVIEGKQIQRLGGKASLPVDVRIIAATNQDLPKLVAEQRFRRDLYFRLNVVQIQLPSLRERRQDIPALLEHYVELLNRQTGAAVEGFTPEAVNRLTEYDWPGNVRELKNVVESIFLDPPYPRIDVCHLSQSGAGLATVTSERDQLLEALQSTQWNKSKAAGMLHWSRMKIYRKMAKYSIADREEHPRLPLQSNVIET